MIIADCRNHWQNGADLEVVEFLIYCGSPTISSSSLEFQHTSLHREGVGKTVDTFSSHLFTVRNEVAKVMFSQACVCPPGGVPGPGRCLVPGAVCSWGGLLPGVPGPRGSAPGGAWSGGVCSGGVVVVSQHALRQTPSGEMATAADGTHPTGMHSCS